jgi:hypothetical protein
LRNKYFRNIKSIINSCLANCVFLEWLRQLCFSLRLSLPHCTAFQQAASPRLQGRNIAIRPRTG